MTNIFLLDNFDSFTYNLVDQFRPRLSGADLPQQPAGEPHHERNCRLRRGRRAGARRARRPHEAGCLIDLIKLARGQVPILGICLGHQALCEAYGGTVGAAGEIVHGKRPD